MPSVVAQPPAAPWLELSSARPVHGPSVPGHINRLKDIRRNLVDASLREDILATFKPGTPNMRLPTLILYDELGLRLFEEITFLDEYYLTGDEIDLLKRHSSEIAQKVPAGSMVIELGSGNLRKVRLLLEAFEAQKKAVEYYALDLSRPELERTINQLPMFNYVTVCGLWGTYDDCRAWLKTPSISIREKTILHMGSSIGNFSRPDAAEFLRNFGEILRPGDQMLIGIDACCDPHRVYRAYNDHKGITHRFILNGLGHINRIFGESIFVEDEWRVIGEYVHDHTGGRHQASYSPKKPVMIMGSLITPQDRIFVEQSLKYSPKESASLWTLAGFRQTDLWMKGNEYGLHMIQKPKVPFSPLPSIYAATSSPSVSEWKALWKTWDILSTQMLASTQLLEKPIKLRNACIFYLGHIPTFLDIQITKTTGQPPTQPVYYYDIFERGIDPDVDNPELCHTHSEIPEEWPAAHEILEYQGRVRARLESLYENGHCSIPRDIARGIWASFEHEIMHIETFLYMMLQSDKTLPPPSVPTPDFAAMAETSRQNRVENEWHTVPEQDIVIGIDDPEHGTDDVPFGWDNEKPQRQIHVKKFQAKGRAITNEEYARFLYAKGMTEIPASWVQTAKASELTPAICIDCEDCSDDLPASFLAGKAVRTVYGPVPLEYALDWPVFASYDELNPCAQWLGGRIPTFSETRSIYSYVNKIKRREAERGLNLVDGSLDSCSISGSYSSSMTDESINTQDSLYVDLDGANVGFRNWHPMPVTATGNRLCGQSELGGVWEWTSSPLREYSGFEAMKLYPGYTADFFDGKHNIVQGGSWATHPRIAGRRSFVNWYQRNYKYAWVGARIVRDI
ncbi:hypothetical protein TD95_001129 [Thielaviopsis punctulata]|uniref:Ergothioneine biosynthesis protein 1 n=1 Tax=Thielaviopsis punctulata TaxID=72032 RepID=A0A0F4Z9B8_9PEZI|nr:hypothetical protein TD95_001129 [Thielaviopsis punctulata]